MAYTFTQIETVHDLIRQVEAQLAAYRSVPVSREISEHDKMFARGVSGAMEHYLSVGYSAIETIARAMICAGKTDIRSVLDLPSGAGRVTRHLRAFFPSASMGVGDIDVPAREFAAKTFAAEIVDPRPDFRDTPRQNFDLIFVGSLVTHFDADQFRRAVQWLTRSLTQSGLLVVTTHGRRHDQFETQTHHCIEPSRWAAVANSVKNTGFGYVETERQHDLSIGANWSRPSWLMRLVEDDPALQIILFQEAAWDQHQDVLVLQRT